MFKKCLGILELLLRICISNESAFFTQGQLSTAPNSCTSFRTASAPWKFFRTSEQRPGKSAQSCEDRSHRQRTHMHRLTPQNYITCVCGVSAAGASRHRRAPGAPASLSPSTIQYARTRAARKRTLTTHLRNNLHGVFSLCSLLGRR